MPALGLVQLYSMKTKADHVLCTDVDKHLQDFMNLNGSIHTTTIQGSQEEMKHSVHVHKPSSTRHSGCIDGGIKERLHKEQNGGKINYTYSKNSSKRCLYVLWFSFRNLQLMVFQTVDGTPQYLYNPGLIFPMGESRITNWWISVFL